MKRPRPSRRIVHVDPNRDEQRRALAVLLCVRALSITLMGRPGEVAKVLEAVAVVMR